MATQCLKRACQCLRARHLAALMRHMSRLRHLIQDRRNQLDIENDIIDLSDCRQADVPLSSMMIVNWIQLLQNTAH